MTPRADTVTRGVVDPAVWPVGTTVADDGAVSVAGVDLRDLAREHGTPAYVLDENDFRRRARLFREAFTEAFAVIGTGVDVYYAGKAFLSVAVARWAHEEGLRIDTATGGELAVALRAGVPGAHIGLHGNNKSDDEIARAVEAGVGRVVIDSRGEVDRVADAAVRAGVRAPVMVRVTTGVHAGGHEYIATAHEDQKFGLSVTGGQAMEVLEAVLTRPELDLVGIHSHIGSQILETSGFEAAAHRLLELRAELAERTGHLVREVDLGGGYGIAYLPGETSLDPREAAEAMARAVAAACAELGTPVPHVSIEPGRAIVGPAGITLYTVGTVKPVRIDAARPEAAVGGPAFAADATTDPSTGSVRTYVSVDGGMSDNIRPALYDARYSAALVNRRGSDGDALARVVGKHCESGDIVVHDVFLPADVATGDLLGVPATGAYGRSMASNYNMVPRPPVLAVRDGVARVLVRRETEDDLLALDLG